MGTGMAFKLNPLIKDYNKLVHDPKMKVTERVAFMDFSYTLVRTMTLFEGYESVEEYYEDATYDETVKDIQIPFFFLNGKDDILTGPNVVPT
mmetsp:Transcript_28633/g.27624  ORF Transcript_28633/g.27624 Transcript_28633/m.27624 type:complete len:92 (+) Transcript_28633:826-1101(+)